MSTAAFPKSPEVRRKIVMIPADYVLFLFSSGMLFKDHIRVPKLIGLPSTAKPVGVWHDYQCNAFALVLEDQSFEATPFGLQYPRIEIEWVVVQLAIKCKKTDAP